MDESARGRLATAIVGREDLAGGVSVLYVEGPLRWPLGPVLRQRVEALLGRGVRTILLDLKQLEAIDAAGVGELVELRLRAQAAGGELWIDNVDRRLRALLERAGLLELLSLDGPFGFEKCS